MLRIIKPQEEERMQNRGGEAQEGRKQRNAYGINNNVVAKKQLYLHHILRKYNTTTNCLNLTASEDPCEGNVQSC